MMTFVRLVSSSSVSILAAAAADGGVSAPEAAAGVGLAATAPDGRVALPSRLRELGTEPSRLALDHPPAAAVRSRS